jgi:hypothetical protein
MATRAEYPQKIDRVSGQAISVLKETLGRMSARMAVAESVQDSYDEVVVFSQEVLNAEAAALFLEDESGENLAVVAAEGYGKNLLRRMATYERGEGITGKVWETGETVRCDSHEEMVQHVWRKGKFDRQQWDGEKQCHNLLFVPLRRNGHVFGVLKVENKRSGDGQYTPFTRTDTDLLECIAAAIGLAVQQAMLSERRMKRPNQDEFICSVVRYRTDEVEAFLSLDRRHLDGPIIERDGRSAPRMQVARWYHDHPEGWDDLEKEVRARHGSFAAFLESLKARGGVSTDWKEWPRGLSVKEHQRQLQDAHPGLKVLAMQGVGDLTMNLNTAGVIDGTLVVPPEERRRVLGFSGPKAETYSCLVKTRIGMSRLAIRDIHVAFGDDTPVVTVSNRDGSKSNLGQADIEFAVYGQQLIRNGELVPLESIAPQFCDVRHLFALIQLKGRFFGSAHTEEVYFGEAQFFDDPTLCRRAFHEPVLFDTQYTPRGTGAPLGADVDQVITKLSAAYDEVNGRAPARPGEFCRPGREGTEFSIYLKPSYYPLTMIGLDAPRETLYLMAISGQSGRFSLTVANAARLFRDRFGVSDALLMDEGVDVFQQVGGQQPVPMNRRQVRAALAVGRTMGASRVPGGL